MLSPLSPTVEELKIYNERGPLIKPRFQLRWSPKQIAKLRKPEYSVHMVSGKTIYNYVHLNLSDELKKLAMKDH